MIMLRSNILLPIRRFANFNRRKFKYSVARILIVAHLTDVDTVVIQDVAYSTKPAEPNRLPRQNFPELAFISGDDEVTRPRWKDDNGHWRGCGTAIKAYSDGIDVRVKMETCGLQGCPVCFRQWAKATGDHLAGTIWAMYLTMMTGHLYHVCISPPDDDSRTVDEIEQALHSFLKLAHQGRYELGYSLVTHLSRVKCANCGDAPEDKQLLGPGISMPTKCSCGSTEFVQLYSPHFHLITNAYVPMKYPHEEVRVACLQNQYGLRYENISQDRRKGGKPGHFLSREALALCVTYELGHAAYRNTHDIPGPNGPIEIENTYERARPAFRLFGLFNPKRWSRASDVPQFTKVVIPSALGLPMYEIEGEQTPDNGFRIKRDAKGHVIYRIIERKDWVEVDGETRLTIVKERVLLTRNEYNPKLRLKSWADGTLIHYPPDGHKWVDLVQDAIETHNPPDRRCRELSDEDFDILTSMSDETFSFVKGAWKQSHLGIPTKI